MLTICVLSANIRHGGHVLDVCDIPVYDIDGNLSGYLGAAWGQHVRPDWPEILIWEFCEPVDVETTLNARGFKRMFE